MSARRALRLLGLLVSLTATLAPPCHASPRHLPEGPVRIWQAVVQHADRSAQLDNDRFEGITRLAGGAIRVWVDWDDTRGGSKLAWQVAAGHPDPAKIEQWLDSVAQTAARRYPPNRFCRGLQPDPANDHVPEPSLAAATDCGVSVGNFSSTMLDVEKCGDYETTLNVLAACIRDGHAGAMIQASQMYESGAGLPRKMERSTAMLARAAKAHTPGYRLNGMTLYATALYFGVGIMADRTAAIALFESAARAGDRDAAQFLRTGSHSAWRRVDGHLFRDPDFTPHPWR